jgi:diguanylate cyclase (GGDEF)-like protein
MPELRPLAEAFNNALTGDEDDLAPVCSELVRAKLEPAIVIRVTTFLAETFTDEAGAGANVKSLVSTLGYVCSLMITTIASDLSELAGRDALTGLENRRVWDRSLAEVLASEKQVAIALIDLDGLKRINDEHGHHVGDQHLRQFALDLAAAVPEPAQLYRFGGDEYAVISQNSTSEELSDMLNSLAQNARTARFSFGVAHTTSDGRNAEDLFTRADERMYAMKEQHRRMSTGGASAEQM